MKDASSLARKRAAKAMSIALPTRPAGAESLTSVAPVPISISRKLIGVIITPGEIETMRAP